MRLVHNEMVVLLDTGLVGQAISAAVKANDDLDIQSEPSAPEVSIPTRDEPPKAAEA